MGITVEIGCEIFENADDLLLEITEEDGGFKVCVKRGPIGNFKSLLDSALFPSKKRAIQITKEILVQIRTKIIEALVEERIQKCPPPFLDQDESRVLEAAKTLLKNVVGREVDQGGCLTMDLIEKISEDLSSFGRSTTYEIAKA